MENPDQYLEKAKACVIQSFNRENSREENKLTPEDLYIVWFAKTLGNWKALISTDKWDGMYWEVTYNGAKQEAYVDGYLKSSNRVVSDTPVGI